MLATNPNSLVHETEVRRATKKLDEYEEFYRALERGETPGTPPMNVEQAYDTRVVLTAALWALARDDEPLLRALIAERPDMVNHALDREGALRNHTEAISQ